MAATGSDGAAVGQPSEDQCWAGIRTDQWQINGCSSEQRFCPNGYRLGLGTTCLDISPAERARRERARQAEAAAAAERARVQREQQLAAERAAAARQAEIDALTRRLGGEQRRREAERLIQMRDAATRARSSSSLPPRRTSCRMVTRPPREYAGKISDSAAEANADLDRAAGGICSISSRRCSIYLGMHRCLGTFSCTVEVCTTDAPASAR